MTPISGKRLKETPPRKRRLIPALLAAALLFWIPIELYLSNNVPNAERAAIRSSRLPAGFDGFRILHLSDLHEKVFGENNETLLRMVRAERPDIIAVTGDLVDSEKGLAYAEDLFPRLAAVAPVYYVTGNHEWAADGRTAYLGNNRLISRLKRIVLDSGAVWMDSAFILLEHGGDTIVLSGMCDPNGPRDELRNPGELLSRIREAHGGAFIVLLHHRNHPPEYFPGFDLVLTGHAHGGVIRLPFTDGLINPYREWFPKGTSGVLRSGGVQVVVSRGLGDTYFPRFLNRPQLLTVTLRRNG